MIKQLSIVLVGTVALTACASENQVYGPLSIAATVKGDESFVAIGNVYSAGDAYPLADRHCAQYNTRPIFLNSSLTKFTYECR